LGTDLPETLFRELGVAATRNGVSRTSVPKQEFGNEDGKNGLTADWL
jgi:hypothetical protein